MQAKGFDVLIPRLTSRALIRYVPTSRVWQGREALQRQDGWQLLLSLELAVTREVEARRLGPWWSRNTVPTGGPARTQPADVARISRRVRAEQRAEYLVRYSAPAGNCALSDSRPAHALLAGVASHERRDLVHLVRV